MRFHPLACSIALACSLGLALAACGGTETDADTAGDELTSSSSEVRTGDRPDRPARPDVIECRTDDVCPRGSYCEAGLHFCFTASRCVVNSRPSDEFCERTYGEDFVCLEYGPDSFHCVPVEPERRPDRGR
jgi:hypothetical protein